MLIAIRKNYLRILYIYFFMWDNLPLVNLLNIEMNIARSMCAVDVGGSEELRK